MNIFTAQCSVIFFFCWMGDMRRTIIHTEAALWGPISFQVVRVSQFPRFRIHLWSITPILLRWVEIMSCIFACDTTAAPIAGLGMGHLAVKPKSLTVRPHSRLSTDDPLRSITDTLITSPHHFCTECGLCLRFISTGQLHRDQATLGPRRSEFDPSCDSQSDFGVRPRFNRSYWMGKCLWKSLSCIIDGAVQQE